MFASYENLIIYDSDSNSGSDIDYCLHFVFLGNKKIVATFDIEPKGVRKIESHYIIKGKIVFFWKQINLSSSGNGQEFIL